MRRRIRLDAEWRFLWKHDKRSLIDNLALAVAQSHMRAISYEMQQ